MPRYRVGIPIQYRNTEYLDVDADTRQDAVEQVIVSIDAEAAIRQAVNNDGGVATILTDEVWADLLG